MASSHHTASQLEREKIPILLGPNRDRMCPDLYWAIDHPAVPTPNRVLIMESDLSPNNMEAVFQWEEDQQMPNFATDEQLAAEGRFHVPWEFGVLHVFVRQKGSLNAHNDVPQVWFTPSEMIPEDLRDNLRAATEQAMGPKEQVTLDAPKRNSDGTFSGGIALERGGEGRSKPVKPGTRCYTMANSHQSAKQTWGPSANAKVYESFDDYNKMTHGLIVAAAEIGQFANEQAPPEVYETTKRHAKMLNIPPLGVPGNWAYQTLQTNVAPAVVYGSATRLSANLGYYGDLHRDTLDSPGRFTNMTMCSPRIPDGYILGKFHMPRFGIYFTLRNFDSLNFCGLNKHGGTPVMAPPGTAVARDAYRITLIQYPPESMGDGNSHVALAAWPDPKNPILKMTAEMQNVDCEARRNQVLSNRANFAHDGQVTNDVQSHITFMVHAFLQLVIFLALQLPLSYGLRIDSDRFLGSFSFEVEPGVRQSIGPWEEGPGFRLDENTSSNAPALSDGRDLISQDALRSDIKRRYRLHYNKLARHIPYAFVKGKAYEIDEAGNLLEDAVQATEDLRCDELGNPIERGGRPWPKPTGPKSHARAARKEKADRKAKSARALDLAAGKAHLRRSKRKTKRRGGNAGSVDISAIHEPGAIWATPAYSVLGNALSSSEPGQLGAIRINSTAVDSDSNPTPMLDDVDDPMEFLDVTVGPEPTPVLDDVDDPMEFFDATVGPEKNRAIKFVQRLDHEAIVTDFQAVVDASQRLAVNSSSPSRSEHLELAMAAMINDPVSLETCLHISHAWSEIRHLHASNAETVLTLKLERQGIMQTTYAFWTWLGGICGNIIERALTPSLVDPPILATDWISRLTRHVQMLLQTRGPPRKLLSQDFGAGILNGTYTFPSRRAYDIHVDPAEVKGRVRDVLACWLNFPVDTDSRAQAWFIEACRACNPALLYLDCTWFAFCRVDVEVFGRQRTSKLPPLDAYTQLYTALMSSEMADPRSQESCMLAQIEGIVSEYREGAMQPQATPGHNALASRDGSQAQRHHTPDPLPLLTPTEDLVELRMMNRFLEYLLQCEPLIDGVNNISNPTLLQSTVAKDLDFLLPFREHGPSRIQARGPGRAFDPSHAKTKTGLFKGLLFRGVTFSSQFGREPSAKFWDSPSAFTATCAEYPDAASDFFCNPYAYSRRKSKRNITLVNEYWAAVMEHGHGQTWETMANEGKIPFADCYKFLSRGKPGHFKEIGSLAGFLLAADFVYAGVVTAPTAEDVGTIIRDINKGAVKGLELLHLVTPRTRGPQKYRMANVEEVRAKFVRLYNFLDEKLTDAQKMRMIFDALMVENGLCKVTRVVRGKVFIL